jgi:hypothetical protein
MTEYRHPLATAERIQHAEVGDVFTVTAATEKNDDSLSNHAIELHDPPGRAGTVFNCRRCDAWYYSAQNFRVQPCVPDSRHTPDQPFVIDDTTKEQTRTLVLDIPMPDLLHALFRSAAYQWHTRYRWDVDVMLLTDAGLKSFKVYPHDGDVSPPSLEDFVSDGSEDDDSLPHDKAAATFALYGDGDLVDATAEELLAIARDAPVYSTVVR